MLPELLGRLNGDRIPAEARPPAIVGAASRVFHAHLAFYGRRPKRASYFVWRAGTTLAVVMVLGPSFAENDRAAAGYAQRQQIHIARPTPYTEAELFDGEVPLDDPSIDLPVYWLGRSFVPGDELPSDRLFDSGFAGKPTPESHEGRFAEAPQPPLYIRYETIRLDAWAPATWHVYADSATGRAITGWKCTRTRSVTLPDGSATIFGGYDKDFRRCPKRPPRAFTAWVHFNGATVVVNPPSPPTRSKS